MGSPRVGSNARGPLVRSGEGWCQANGPWVPGGMTSSAHASSCLAGKVCSRVVCCLVQYCADVEASAPKNETRDAGWKPCKGAKGVWGQLEGGYGFRCNCEGFLGFPRSFLRVSDISVHDQQPGLLWRQKSSASLPSMWTGFDCSHELVVSCCADGQTFSPKNQTMQVKALDAWGQLEGGYLRVSVAAVMVSSGFQGVSWQFLTGWNGAQKMRCGLAWEGCVMQRRQK